MNEPTDRTAHAAAPTPQLRHTIWAKRVGLGVLALAMLSGIFLLATIISDDKAAQELVQRLGYVGVLIVSFIAGLNAIVPVPAGSFVPIFLAAGLSMPLIIATLVVGTTLADLLAFYVGMKGREFAAAQHPRVINFTTWLRSGKEPYIIPGVFLYAAFSPIPNELILIPLALAGVRFRTLVLPLFLGTIVYQTAFALGAQGIFNWLIDTV